MIGQRASALLCREAGDALERRLSSVEATEQIGAGWSPEVPTACVSAAGAEFFCLVRSAMVADTALNKGGGESLAAEGATGGVEAVSGRAGLLLCFQRGATGAAVRSGAAAASALDTQSAQVDSRRSGETDRADHRASVSGSPLVSAPSHLRSARAFPNMDGVRLADYSAAGADTVLPTRADAAQPGVTSEEERSGRVAPLGVAWSAAPSPQLSVGPGYGPERPLAAEDADVPLWYASNGAASPEPHRVRTNPLMAHPPTAEEVAAAAASRAEGGSDGRSSRHEGADVADGRASRISRISRISRQSEVYSTASALMQSFITDARRAASRAVSPSGSHVVQFEPPVPTVRPSMMLTRLPRPSIMEAEADASGSPDGKAPDRIAKHVVTIDGVGSHVEADTEEAEKLEGLDDAGAIATARGEAEARRRRVFRTILRMLNRCGPWEHCQALRGPINAGEPTPASSLCCMCVLPTWLNAFPSAARRCVLLSALSAAALRWCFAAAHLCTPFPSSARPVPLPFGGLCSSCVGCSASIRDALPSNPNSAT